MNLVQQELRVVRDRKEMEVKGKMECQGLEGPWDSRVWQEMWDNRGHLVCQDSRD